MIARRATCGTDYSGEEYRWDLEDVPLNLSDKDQKWLGIKDTFKY